MRNTNRDAVAFSYFRPQRTGEMVTSARTLFLRFYSLPVNTVCNRGDWMIWIEALCRCLHASRTLHIFLSNLPSHINPQLTIESRAKLPRRFLQTLRI